MTGTSDGSEDWVRRLLSEHEVGPMPAEVSTRLEQTISRLAAAESRTDGPTVAGTDDTGSGPGPAPARVVRLDGARRERRQEAVSDRRRLLLRTLLPVAAGVAVVGLGATATVQLLDRDATTGADSQGAAAAAPAELPVPRGLVATGTSYAVSDPAAFAQQIDDLVAVASGAVTPETAPSAQELVPLQDSDAAQGAQPEAAPDAASEQQAVPQARDALPSTPLLDPEEYARCAEDLTDGETRDPLAVDLATVDGIERAVVVVADRTGDGYFVYVVGRACEQTSGVAFYPVTPP